MHQWQGELILINVEDTETRVAILENSLLEEFYVQTQGQEGIVGNIYKGKVSSILPGMNAAFVDIGEGKNGFLYVDEVTGPVEMEEIKDADLTAGSNSRKPKSRID